MQEDPQKMTCGCDCESCKAGDHEKCQTGACTWKGKTTVDDANADGSDGNQA